MADQTSTTQTPTTGTQTVAKAQINAIRAGIRAAASSNPQGIEHGQRCAELSQSLCCDFDVERLADLPASCFPLAMKKVAEMGIPTRRHGPIEFRLRACKTALADTIASILQARRDVAAFRREAEGALLASLKDALDVNGKGNLEAVAQESLGYLIAMPLLDAEHELDRIQSTLQVLSSHLPGVGRALDERMAGTALPTAGAD